MPQQPAKPGIRAGQALGLTVFLATAAFLTALFFSRVGSAFESMLTVAAAFSTLCAAIAAFGMLLDAVDLWVRGRRMTPHGVKMLRSLVFVAVLGALAASMFGGNSLVVLLLGPAMIIYLMTVHTPSPPRRAESCKRGHSRGRPQRERASRAAVTRPGGRSVVEAPGPYREPRGPPVAAAAEEQRR